MVVSEVRIFLLCHLPWKSPFHSTLTSPNLMTVYQKMALFPAPFLFSFKVLLWLNGLSFFRVCIFLIGIPQFMRWALAPNCSPLLMSPCYPSRPTVTLLHLPPNKDFYHLLKAPPHFRRFHTEGFRILGISPCFILQYIHISSCISKVTRSHSG